MCGGSYRGMTGPRFPAHGPGLCLPYLFIEMLILFVRAPLS